MNDDIIIQYRISLEDFQEILRDEDLTDKQIEKAFNSEIIRYTLQDKLGYSEYTIIELEEIIRKYIEDIKNDEV
jgi:hypothetical protein